jgi:glycosyltransferase involved in cell wall biosynthesis
MVRKFLEIQMTYNSLGVYFVGSYLPRRCGIATFTYDLAHAVGNEIGRENYRIAAINNRAEGYDYPEEVAFEINQNRINDYRLAADYVNYSGVDVVCLQHEFGIFGGPEGTYINHFLGNLKKPVLTTFHTVMREPSEEYRRALQGVAELSQGVVVMSRQAVEILNTVYGIPEHKIHFIHHGVPDVPFVDPNYYKDQFQVEGRFVILTFGLLSPNKGLETVIKGLPEVVKRFPNIAYIILGETHPEIKKVHGEEYRISLQRRVIRLGLEKHVFFHNRFVDLEELCEFMGACDIYITPYLSREQITSGTLGYALGMGKAVISTPYIYAREMLEDGRGKLIEFGDFRGLSQAVNHLIENELVRHQMRKKAYELGRTMVWSHIGRQYLKAFHEILESYQSRSGLELFQSKEFPQEPLPEINLNQVFRLTDDTGIIHHSLYGIPDRRHGYSTDDTAVALIVALMAYNQLRDENFLNVSNTYLSFLRYAQLETGRFRTEMNYARHFIQNDGDEDTWGKSIWSLGCAVHLAPMEGFRNLARELFERAISEMKMEQTLPKAYAILGLTFFLRKYAGATAVKRTLQSLADELAETYITLNTRSWFPEFVSYANAKIAHALLVAYKVLGNETYREIALDSLDSLIDITFAGDYFNFLGNDKSFEGRDDTSEKPVDAGYMVEALILAYEVTGKIRYRELARTAFDWFLGRNRLGVMLYDFSTGACYDGLGPHGLNLNQSAESALSFLLANLAVSEQQISTPMLSPEVSAYRLMKAPANEGSDFIKS